MAGLAAYFIVQRIPSVYEATETVGVNPPTSDTGVADVQTAQALADSYAEQMHAKEEMTMDAVTDKILSLLGLPET